MKAVYKDMRDEQHARVYAERAVTTLAQTSSLIESSVRTIQKVEDSNRLVALGYKMSSLVHLTIYRLQHYKLFSLYSDLFVPGRSPDSRQNGTTPPISGSGSESRESTIRSHLLKEMEHTLRGFEMWRRYETCNVEVLPRINNPAVTDLNVFFEDLEAELSPTRRSRS
ncbi:hypothetical protein PINS_up015371 [Pythium insidiosum]|nr:hypothetical protein PINS_up015371 [Pythium insidiosum]